jgi:DNA-binding XRE family transcriptional regulator
VRDSGEKQLGRQSHEAQRLLRRYRTMRSRADIGLTSLVRRRVGETRAQAVRQADMDRVLEGGSGTYQKIESGAFPPSRALFLEIARLLGFSSHHLRIAHLDLYGTEPVLPIEGGLPHRWQQVLDGQSEMACALAPDGGVIASNHAFNEIFVEGRPPANFWHWALWSEEAQTTLLDLEKRWVPHLLTELKLARYRHPNESAVQRICTALEREPRLNQIEESLIGLADVPLPLRHPQRGPGIARFMTAHTAGGIGIWTLLFEPN